MLLERERRSWLNIRSSISLYDYSSYGSDTALRKRFLASHEQVVESGGDPNRGLLTAVTGIVPMDCLPMVLEVRTDTIVVVLGRKALWARRFPAAYALLAGSLAVLAVPMREGRLDLCSIVVLAAEVFHKLFVLLVVLQTNILGLLRSFLVSFYAWLCLFDCYFFSALHYWVTFFEVLLAECAHAIIPCSLGF